ncbi:MAG TPA: asparaginase [Ignavibacteriaceae bacterium]|nr:asparaginase [Ignavibacteriaceae bacterium]
MKKILVVFTGGTFSMMIDEKTGGAIPRYSGNELLGMMPEAKSLAEIGCFDFGKYPGPHVTPELMLDLSIKINAKLKTQKYDGVIVTHGTDTLEETAYFLDLTIKTEIPIVVIGAMKNSSELDWDGPKNLIDAIHICLNENSKNLGVLVCLNGEIVESFKSLDFGTLGFVQNGRVIFNRLPQHLETIQTEKINTNVDLLTVYAGMDEKFFKFSADSGVDGIVVEALGVGNVPPPAFEGIKYAVEKSIPVVLTSRCPAGETDYVYSYPGAGKHLHNLGVIFSDYLNGQKARIKLMIVLGLTKNQDEIRKYFE